MQIHFVLQNLKKNQFVNVTTSDITEIAQVYRGGN